MILPQERGADDRVERLNNLMNLPLEWVRNLHEVDYPILKQLDRIRELMEQARESAHQAALLRTSAYAAALHLEDDMRQRWPREEIDKARNAGDAQMQVLWMDPRVEFMSNERAVIST
jgi:hypothetical protein